MDKAESLFAQKSRFTLLAMSMHLEGLSTAVVGRRLPIAPDKPLVIKTNTANHAVGQVKVAVVDGVYVLTNGSRMPCKVNGKDESEAVLANGDEVIIGKDRFRVVIGQAQADDDHDRVGTQELAAAAAAKAAAAPLCSVCDGVIDDNKRARMWSDGERRICARCLAKGVKPDHLPRPSPPPSAIDIGDITPMPSPVLPERRGEASSAATGSPPKAKSRAPAKPIEDAPTETHERPASEPGLKKDASDSDRLRHSRRISASRLAAVEAAPSGREGLFSRVGKVFGRRDERFQRLEELDRLRAALFAEAGRHALEPGSGIGLPESAMAALLRGEAVTLRAEDLSSAALERWRAQRQRMNLLDAEIGALRQALKLGADPGAYVQQAPALRPDQKEEQERTFAALDGMATDDLSKHARQRQEATGEPPSVIEPKTAAAHPVNVRHRPSRRRR